MEVVHVLAKTFSRINFILIVFIIIFIILLVAWTKGGSSHYLPFAGAGETLDAMHYINNFRLYGFKYFLVQDYATAPHLSAHPFYYTHDVNLGGIILTFLEAFGIKSFAAKQVFTLFAFGTGLLYAYLSTAYITRSKITGLLFFLLFSTDIGHVFVYSLNSLRVWSWLAILGLIYHLAHLLLEPKSHPKKHWVAVFFLGCIGFGLAYEFWIIQVLFGISLVLLCGGTFKKLALTCTIFSIPFILRQIQIATVLGLDFWAKDLYYSAVIKVSLLNRIFSIPAISEIDQLYSSLGVVRAPSQPASSLDEIINTFSQMFYAVTVPTYGILSVICAISIGIICLFRFRRHFPSRVLVALYFSITVGVAFFAPFSFHIYLKHDLPLIAIPFHLAKAICITLIVTTILKTKFSIKTRWLMASCILVLFTFDQMIVQIRYARNLKGIDFSYISELEKRSSASFAVSYIPYAASNFTRNWAIGIRPGSERGVTERMRDGEMPFLESDLLLFGERDAKANIGKYLQPDYWLYFPTDTLNHFDYPSAQCWDDFWIKSVREHFQPKSDMAIKRSLFWIYPVVVKPGGDNSAGGYVDYFNNLVEKIEIVIDPEKKTVAEANYNCIFDKFEVNLKAPVEKVGKKYYSIWAHYPSGAKVRFSEFSILTQNKDVPTTKIHQPLMPQPTIEEIIEMSPLLEVVARGPGYVLFDMRKLYKRAFRQGVAEIGKS